MVVDLLFPGHGNLCRFYTCKIGNQIPNYSLHKSIFVLSKLRNIVYEEDRKRS